MGEITLCAICATKGRAQVFYKKAYPLLLSLGVPFLVGVEQSEAEDYSLPAEISVVYPDGIGQATALKILAKKSKAKYILKIDDDVFGFRTPAGIPKFKENIPRFIQTLENYEKCGGIAFLYEQEFYQDHSKMYSFMNHRLQTVYLVRAFFLESTRRHDPFEDICTFMEIVDQGFFTLLCPLNRIKCLPVGETPGGLNDANRAEMGMRAILKMRVDFPSFQIGIKNRSDKSWKVEPDYSKEKMLKKIRL